MTTANPGWCEFAARLWGPEGCDFRDTPDGGITWNCNGNSRDRAVAILRDMGATDTDLLATLDYFDANGGYCDCEILLNVDRGLCED